MLCSSIEIFLVGMYPHNKLFLVRIFYYEHLLLSLDCHFEFDGNIVFQMTILVELEVALCHSRNK